MAISFVGATGVAEHSLDDTIRINKPNGVLQGDLMIAFVNNFHRLPDAPRGWDLIYDLVDGSDTNNFSVWMKFATESEANHYNWYAQTSYGDITWDIVIVAYRGVDPTNPIADQNAHYSSGSSLNTNAVATTGNDMWLVYGSAARRETSNPSSCDTSRTGDSERKDIGETNYDFSRSLAVYDTNGPVVEGSYNPTLTRTTSVSVHITQILALASETSGGGGSGEEPDQPGSLDNTVPGYGVTQRFLDSLQRSHEVVSYVDVKSANQEVLRLLATDGSVEVDRTADTRRRCTVSCLDITGDLTPSKAGDILSPYGTEILPYRGIVYPDGTIEAVPLGVFRISSVSIKDDGKGVVISIEGYDRARTISRDKFTSPYTIETGTSIVDALKDIVRRTFPEVPISTITSPRTVETTRVYDVGEDPWESVKELATSLGCDVFFDVQGRLVVVPPPNIDSLPSPKFSYVEGEGTTLLTLDRKFTDDPGYNGVVVVGESPGDEEPPVRGIAWDDEPSSFTYHKGPYGEVPMFHQDQLVKTEEDANDLAHALLQNLLGFVSQLGISIIANPLLECSDVIRVKRAKTKVDDLFVIDSFSVPFKASGDQSLTLRQKRTVG